MSDNALVDRIAAIQGLRPTTAQRVADAYPTAQELAAATQDDLTQIKGIGAVTAARIVEEFAGTAPTDDAVEADATDARADATSGDTADEATVTSIDAGRAGDAGSSPQPEPAGDPIEQLKVAAKVVTTGAFAVVGTIQEHLPEVKDSVGKAAGAIVDLGREVGRAIFRRAS